MEKEEMKRRTLQLSLRVVRMVRSLPEGLESRVFGGQVLRSATSIGANYRSAHRGRSKADFISKLSIAEEEADETCYWLELIIAAELLPKRRVEPLLAEAREVTAILTAAGKTAKGNIECGISNIECRRMGASRVGRGRGCAGDSASEAEAVSNWDI